MVFQKNDKTRLTHGKSTTPIYHVWSCIKRRCKNKNSKDYKYYGGRGITYTSSWDKFEGFLKDMGKNYKKGLQIDRIDNNKGYSKENCRWVTRKVQANNKRSNRLFTINGITKNIEQWSQEKGVPAHRVRHRLKKGWSIEKSLSKQLFHYQGNQVREYNR